MLSIICAAYVQPGHMEFINSKKEEKKKMSWSISCNSIFSFSFYE